jgi:uncharacterized phage-associated protein
MEATVHSSAAVANRFLELARQQGKPLTPMQLLKLVYIAHGWMLGLYGRPLIKDDVEAWQYGPVIPKLYRQTRQYKGSPVTEVLSQPFGEKPLDEAEDDVIQQVFNVYGGRTAMQLSRMTHAAGTPWDLTYEPGGFGDVIPNDLIEEHYRRLAERASERENA